MYFGSLRETRENDHVAGSIHPLRFADAAAAAAAAAYGNSSRQGARAAATRPESYYRSLVQSHIQQSHLAVEL